MSRFLKLIRIFLPALVLLTGCDKKENAQASQGSRPRGSLTVEAFVAATSSISEDVDVPGSLLPLENTQIRSEVSGRIVELNIPEGSTVPKGFVMVKLFDKDLQAQLRKLKVQLQIAIKTAQRLKELLAINGISQQEYDLSMLAADNLRADIQTVEIAITKMQIHAPYQGQVGLRSVSVGAYISPSDVITTLRDVSQLKLEFSVPEKYAKNISKGQQIHFRVDGGLVNHAAKVMATEGNVEASTRTLKVRALVSEKHPELVPGIFARVKLELGKDNKAIMLPTQAIIPMARNKRVILLRKDSAIFRVVETGLRDSTYVQILSGVKAGDTVITTGLMAIRPGAKVKISAVKQKD